MLHKQAVNESWRRWVLASLFCPPDLPPNSVVRTPALTPARAQGPHGPARRVPLHPMVRERSLLWHGPVQIHVRVSRQGEFGLGFGHAGELGGEWATRHEGRVCAGSGATGRRLEVWLCLLHSPALLYRSIASLSSRLVAHRTPLQLRCFAAPLRRAAHTSTETSSPSSCLGAA